MGLFGLIAEVIVLGCCMAAVVTNLLLIFSCEFFDVQYANGVSGSIGLFQVKTAAGGGCILWDDISSASAGLIAVDTPMKVAQVCSCVAFCMGMVLFVFGFMRQCCCPLPFTQILMDLSASFIQAFLAMTYAAWATESCDKNTCTYGEGSILLLLTQIFWLLAGMFTRCMRPGRRERRKGEAEEGGK